MQRIEISVIVPIYNTGVFLPECLDSILAQDGQVPYEVLLVDDGSTDGCGEICDEYAAKDPRVRVFHQENQGLSAARNTGIDAARGRYYAFVDSDDVVLPAYLSTLYAACEKHDAYMALCAVEDVQENGRSCVPPHSTHPNREGVFCGKDLLNEFYTPNGTVYTVAWNKLYRAEVWKLLHYPEGLADRYRFYVENNADRTVIDSAYAACWRRYLFLCAKVRQNPTPQLVKAISKEQFLMQGLISYLPNCRHMKMTEKLSAARWSMMSAESLCPLKK